IDSWNEAYRGRLVIKAHAKSPIGWDMRGGGAKITHANEALMDAVFSERFLHNGNRILRKHALNARRRENRWCTTFGKESRESPLKVDAYAATLLARWLSATFVNQARMFAVPVMCTLTNTSGVLWPRH